MKVLVINSSLRNNNQSVTHLMVTQLADGMTEAGAEVEVVHLRKKRLKDCKGCYTCQTDTPGRCIINDDMTNEIFPRWLESDLVVYATPLFHHNMNAPMKRFIERTFPVCQPIFRRRKNGLWTNPLRFRYPAAVVLSVGGYLDETAFSNLSHYANFLWGKGLLAEIYRPAAEFMSMIPAEGAREVLEATRQAGRELVQFSAVSPETMARVKQPFGSIEEMLDQHNSFWEDCAANGKRPGYLDRKETVLVENS